jgi:hypothetical protein
MWNLFKSELGWVRLCESGLGVDRTPNTCTVTPVHTYSIHYICAHRGNVNLVPCIPSHIRLITHLLSLTIQHTT